MKILYPQYFFCLLYHSQLFQFMSFYWKLQRFFAVAVTTSVAPDMIDLSTESSFNKTSDKNLHLSAVHVYFRHGARAPYNDLPGKAGHVAFWDSKKHCRAPQHAMDIRIVNGEGVLRDSPPYAPDKGESKLLQGGGDCWTSAFTVEGQNDCLALGRRLRHRYGQLLSHVDKDLQLRSTNFVRTIYSLRCLLYGLLATEKMHISAFDLPPVEVVNRKEDSLFPTFFNYNASQEHLLSVRRSITNALKCEDPALDEEFNDPQSSKFLLLYNMYDAITSFSYHGFPIPQTLLEHKSKLEWAACMEIRRQMLGDSHQHVDNLSRVVGRELDKLREKLQSNSIAIQHPSFYLNATHDTFIMCLLEAFEVFDFTWPNYAADLVVELWKESVSAAIPKFWVRVVYCGKVLHLPDSDNGWCSLEEFSRRLSGYS